MLFSSCGYLHKLQLAQNARIVSKSSRVITVDSHKVFCSLKLRIVNCILGSECVEGYMKFLNTAVAIAAVEVQEGLWMEKKKKKALFLEHPESPHVTLVCCLQFSL